MSQTLPEELWTPFCWIGPSADVDAFKARLEVDLRDSTQADLWGPAYGKPARKLDRADTLSVFAVALRPGIKVKLPPGISRGANWLANILTNGMAEPDEQDGKTREERRPRPVDHITELLP